jgi:hypothetical protein
LLIIYGSGFNTMGNTLRFANGLIGRGMNFTVTFISNEQIHLKRTADSYWRRNFKKLPTALTLLAVNAGQGFVAIGATNSAKGQDIATIFEPPQIFSSTKKIFRTHTHEFHIRGAGFPLPSTQYKPLIRFNTPLVDGVAYSIRVVARDDLEIILLDGKAWRPDAGDLIVTYINTRGDEAGWKKLPGEWVHVAQVVEDNDTNKTNGDNEVIKIYHSSRQQSISISLAWTSGGTADPTQCQCKCE